MTRSTIIFLLGKAPKPDTIFPRVFDLLADHGFECRVELPHDHGFDVETWPKGALVVHRGLDRPWVERLVELEQAGWTVCNGAAASMAVRDRHALMARLAAVKLPVPRAEAAATWEEVVRLGHRCGIAVKALDGSHGRSAGVYLASDGALPEQAPFPGPYHIEAFVANDGLDRKIYVAGAACGCLLKPWPREAHAAQAVDVDPEMTLLARRVGETLHLDLYGVDIVMGSRGAAIVDVNLFPSFKDVPHGAEMVADQIALRARRHNERTTCGAP